VRGQEKPHDGAESGARKTETIHERSLIVRRFRAADRRNVERLLRAAHIAADDYGEMNGIIVAIQDGSLVGCSGLEICDSDAILHSVVVEKALRRRGVGTRLVRECLRSARRRQVLIVALMTMFWNVNFFRQLGFRTLSRRDLPETLRDHPLIADKAFKYCTPMMRRLHRRSATATQQRHTRGA
jgi:N-acetylglutamate synthase-like GNAT family acetyltransferase